MISVSFLTRLFRFSVLRTFGDVGISNFEEERLLATLMKVERLTTFGNSSRVSVNGCKTHLVQFYNVTFLPSMTVYEIWNMELMEPTLPLLRNAQNHRPKCRLRCRNPLRGPFRESTTATVA
ncbi:hypothetical protein GCK72_014852 [Caenorhabditis remanei]|uniref:Uncharacterized protein n=1 Tax=Caenorhabditis remanei TaxID=31234 RepID=A0A6A5GUQ7_CAERE|nr:hypothetical protein GCK72_014852 [Caenorhabditis remanei]KAF1758394.1 hypothetical protein GCK72_014852 [Caenorhabditis remanei]